MEQKQELPFRVTLRSIVSVDHLEIVCNGKVARTLQLQGDRKSADESGNLPLDESGWCVLRAFSDKAEYPILDLYPYATTSPVYVHLPAAKLKSPKDAAFFVAWVDRLIAAATADAFWNTGGEKDSVLNMLKQAKQKYVDLTK